MDLDTKALKQLANTVRILSIEGVQQANSGHPGLPMGAADMAVVLWAKYMNFNPQAVDWVNRDRFILSGGHGSMLLYSLLHLFDFGLTIDDLKNFRQWNSKTPGHPEFGYTVGVEATTGPLGQGFANGVGFALSQKMLAQRYSSELFDHKIFAIVSDGDLMEGVAAEAASLAGHLKLNNLIYLYDDNLISLADPTSVCFTDDSKKRFESYGWYVQAVDGHDYQQIDQALSNAMKSDKPSIICARTVIGFGSPNKAGSNKAHGEPLGAAEVQATKDNLGWTSKEAFYVSDEVKEICNQLINAKKAKYNEWQNKFNTWKTSNPELASQYEMQAARTIPANLKQDLLATFAEGKTDATRNLSWQALQVISKNVPAFIGGSADLEPSTKTMIKDGGDVQAPEYSGKNIRFGVREHAMGSAVNGMAYTKHWIPYSATFLVFSDYMRPVIRLAALSHLQSFFIFTHDSFWVGEDGPTHQPIEHIASMRLIPHTYLFRPADGEEVAMCYYAGLNIKNRPSIFVFTRQNLPALKKEDPIDNVLKGAYCVRGSQNNEIVIVATGSEVALALDAADLLEAKGHKIKVVSMPCVELFEEQPQSYKDILLPPNAKKISIEVGVSDAWYKIVGGNGLCIGRDDFGASAPGAQLAEEFGFTADKISKQIADFLNNSK